MSITVDIDKNSGFCAGVIRAIGKAEKFLKDGKREDGQQKIGRASCRERV